MIIDEEVRKSLEENYRFDDWRDSKHLKTNLFAWKFFLSGQEFPGWEPETVRSIESDEETQQPPLSTATLISAGGGPPATILIDAHELESRIAALDFLLVNLAQFQLPYIVRLEDLEADGLGDVVFGTRERTCILFVRGNLIVSVKNAGREPINVEPFARNFDDYLTSQPDATDALLTPEIELIEQPPTQLEPDAVVPFRIREDRWGGRRVWYKFFSDSGRVRQKGGQTFYRAGAAETETHAVKIYAVIPSAGVGESTFLIAGG